MKRDPDLKLHRYDYKLGPSGQFWYCQFCSVLCIGCQRPCARCAHRIENVDCPHNQRFIDRGLIEPISQLRAAHDAADPEHIKDNG